MAWLYVCVCFMLCASVCIYVAKASTHFGGMRCTLGASYEGMLLAPLPLPSAKVPHYRVTGPLIQLPLTLFTLESSDVTYKY